MALLNPPTGRLKFPGHPCFLFRFCTAPSFVVILRSAATKNGSPSLAMNPSSRANSATSTQPATPYRGRGFQPRQKPERAASTARGAVPASRCRSLFAVVPGIAILLNGAFEPANGDWRSRAIPASAFRFCICPFFSFVVILRGAATKNGSPSLAFRAMNPSSRANSATSTQPATPTGGGASSPTKSQSAQRLPLAAPFPRAFCSS